MAGRSVDDARAAGRARPLHERAVPRRGIGEPLDGEVDVRAVEAADDDGGIPQAEPLAEEQAPKVAAKAAVSKPAASALKRHKRVKRAARPAIARSVHKRAATNALPAAPGGSDDGWEDPYR